MYVDVHVGTLASKQACISGACLLVRSNLHLRSQALETLSRLTDANEELDWLNTADHEGEISLGCRYLGDGGRMPSTFKHVSKRRRGGRGGVELQGAG